MQAVTLGPTTVAVYEINYRGFVNKFKYVEGRRGRRRMEGVGRPRGRRGGGEGGGANVIG